jgi:two-component sensor histidine kinase
MAVALREKRPVHGVEAVAERPDGTRMPFIPHPTPLFDDPGRCIGAVNVLVDITERKEAERRRALLSREVDHRAKNLLAVVRSLVRLTRAEDPKRFAETLDGRLAALANAHTLLAADGWEGADLHAVAERELAAHPGRVTFLGPLVRFAPAAVQPVSMLLHELATNAAKHGALSTPAGRVALTWEQDEAGTVRLLWRESGGPRVAEPLRKDFGSRLMENLARQVGGAVVHEWRPEGLRCTATMGAQHVRPQAVARQAA